MKYAFPFICMSTGASLAAIGPSVGDVLMWLADNSTVTQAITGLGCVVAAAMTVLAAIWGCWR